MVREMSNEARPNVFEVVSPGETFTLQATSEAEFKDWISKIGICISNALQHGDHGSASSSKSNLDEDEQEKRIQASTSNTLHAKLQTLPGNRACADCGSDEDVVWASVNLGLLLCIGCSGLHRSLGSHISKVSLDYILQILLHGT
jgi:hypothetical protein